MNLSAGNGMPGAPQCGGDVVQADAMELDDDCLETVRPCAVLPATMSSGAEPEATRSIAASGMVDDS